MRCDALIAGLILSASLHAQATEYPSAAPDTTDIVSIAQPSPDTPTPTIIASLEASADTLPATGSTATLGRLTPLPESVEILPPDAAANAIDLTINQTNLWDRVRQGFSMPDLTNDLVSKQEAWYLGHPDYLRRVVERSRRYMYYIVEEIEKRGMPTELALLPIVESAYNPVANSSASAAGLWQFIPSTGRIYKLDQNWWVDERLDVIASTNAALDYLQTIYEMHGDWQLALASYNWGEGAVRRAVERNRLKGLPTDYSNLERMPRETRNYVPKLQALKNIVNIPELWAMLDTENIPNEPYFAIVPTPADMDIKVAAELAEIPMQEFIALNAAHKRPIIKADIPLIIPADKVDTFNANLANYDDPLLSWQSYTFRKGDSLKKVAARFSISESKLKTINGLGRRSRVNPGQSILVPARGKNNEKVELTKFSPPKSYSSKRTRYTVRKGDTLSAIARRFNVTTRDILRLNGVKKQSIIRPGQRLIIATAD